MICFFLVPLTKSPIIEAEMLRGFPGNGAPATVIDRSTLSPINLFAVTRPPIPLLSSAAHEPPNFPTPGTYTLAQDMAGKLLSQVLKKYSNRPRIAKAATKTKPQSKHQMESSPPRSKSLSPKHQPVHDESPPSYPVDMLSRQGKRRPQTQQCGDEENPEFIQHNKFQVADEEDTEPYDDDYDDL